MWHFAESADFRLLYGLPVHAIAFHMPPIRLQRAVAFLLCIVATAAWGWSMGGHRVTGVMAARALAETAPRAVTAIHALMQSHPAADAFAARLNDAGDDAGARTERLFAEMAQWPDEVRSGPLKAYHRGDWHTIDLPFFVAGYNPPREALVAGTNLLTALEENLRIAADIAAPAADRAVALCWIFHLLGDLHQPLHAASLYSPAFPEGDRHGTRFFVRPPHGDDPVSLHYYWDSIIQRSQQMPEVLRTAAQLQSLYPREALDELRQRPYRDAGSARRWILEESHRLAVSDAYRDGQLAGGADRRSAVRLNEAYATGAQGLAARRMALSAQRLAELLRAIFPQ
jgi:hypothetical protein